MCTPILQGNTNKETTIWIVRGQPRNINKEILLVLPLILYNQVEEFIGLLGTPESSSGAWDYSDWPRFSPRSNWDLIYMIYIIWYIWSSWYFTWWWSVPGLIYAMLGCLSIQVIVLGHGHMQGPTLKEKKKTCKLEFSFHAKSRYYFRMNLFTT